MNISSLNALIEALKARQPISKILISQKKRNKKVTYLKKMCQQNKIVYQIVPQAVIDRKAGPKNQGVFAQLSPVRFFLLDDILKSIKMGLIIILDGINDAGNLGAIIRTAVAAGVDGIMIPLRRSAPINETVMKSSSGTLVNARIIRSKNLMSDIEKLKDNGFWIVATSAKEGQEYHQYDFKYKTAVIIGNENKGISPLLKEKSDQLVSIGHSEKVESLNAAASTAIILFEALRQKLEKK